MFWRGPYTWQDAQAYALGQCKLLATSCVLPSFYLWCPPSNLFDSNKVSSWTRCARYVRHSQDFAPRVQHTYVKHCHDAKSWPPCCISPAPAPSAIALLHRQWLKRTHEVLNFWISRNLKSRSHIFKFLYITQLSYKRKLQNPRSFAIKFCAQHEDEIFINWNSKAVWHNIRMKFSLIGIQKLCIIKLVWIMLFLMSKQHHNNVLWYL